MRGNGWTAADSTATAAGIGTNWVGQQLPFSNSHSDGSTSSVIVDTIDEDRRSDRRSLATNLTRPSLGLSSKLRLLPFPLFCYFECIFPKW